MAHAGKNVVSSQHSKPFAYVEYQVDKYRMPVPQSFIKDFDAQNWSLGQEYWVFWSPKSADTPTSILRSQGVLLDLDNEKETHQRGQSSAMPGYYKALILQVADSAAALEKALKSKRICIPTDKVIAAKNSQKNKTNPRKRDPSYVSKYKMRKIRKASDGITTEKWQKFKAPVEESEDADEPDSDATDSDDTLLTKKDVRIDQQLSERRISQLENRVEELTRLNLFWQRKYEMEGTPQEKPKRQTSEAEESVRRNLFDREKREINEKSVSSSDKHKREVKEKSVSSSDKHKREVKEKSVSLSDKHNRQERDVGKDLLVQDYAGSANCEDKENDLNEKQNPEEKISANEHEENDGNGEPDFEGNRSPIQLSDKDKDTEDEECQSEEEMSFTLTPRKADVALGGVRKGKSGDSLHVRQLLMVIFGASTLSRCSYKGVAAVGGKNKYKMSQQKAARPALPKKGMEVLRDEFLKRLRKENPAIDSDEEEERMECFNDVIPDKIKYLRKRAGLTD
ncbi:unnamed protein product [Bemisia tabaci]|uniref:BEN domain-containing protein n=1 Tax=Bemisia tabaci TaxID=7038 RepID=A0A9P0A3L0_BEMTA|nr:unnamed protein product [Bemisia tabaci]